MSFTQAALVVVAIAAIVLGLVCYHLLSRLEILEQAVQGGLEAPSRRLGREEYEQRFRRALARARLADDVESGLVLVFGDEAQGSAHEVAAALANLGRADGIIVIAQTDGAESFVRSLDLDGLRTRDADLELGSPVTPFAFVVDEQRVTAARSLVSGDDLLELVTRHT